MVPATSDLNFTPSSTELSGPWSVTTGVDVLVQMVLQLLVHPLPPPPPITVTLVLPAGVSRLPLSSTARLRITALLPEAVQEYVQIPCPVAGCQFVPPSVETSTPPMTPFVSLAAPLIVTTAPVVTVDPVVGKVMVETGGIISVEALANVRLDCKDTG